MRKGKKANKVGGSYWTVDLQKGKVATLRTLSKRSSGQRKAAKENISSGGSRVRAAGDSQPNGQGKTQRFGK